MSQPLKNIVLIGASGNLGVTLLQHLIDTSKFNITVISRQSSKATFPSEVRVIKSDFSPSSLEDAFKNQDAVVSLVSHEAIADQTKVLNATIKAGVKRFIPSEFGSDTANEELIKLVPLIGGKKQFIEHLKTKEDQISWTAIATGPFLDWGLQNGFLGFNLEEKTATIFDNGEERVSFSTLAQIGRAVAKVLENPKETANRYVYIASATVTAKSILASLEKATGSKWDVRHMDAKSTIAKAQSELGTNPVAFVDLLRGAIFASSTGGLSDLNNTSSGLWNEKLGLKEEGIDQVVAQVLRE